MINSLTSSHLWSRSQKQHRQSQQPFLDLKAQLHSSQHQGSFERGSKAHHSAAWKKWQAKTHLRSELFNILFRGNIKTCLKLHLILPLPTPWLLYKQSNLQQSYWRIFFAIAICEAKTRQPSWTHCQFDSLQFERPLRWTTQQDYSERQSSLPQDSFASSKPLSVTIRQKSNKERTLVFYHQLTQDKLLRFPFYFSWRHCIQSLRYQAQKACKRQG